MCINKNIQMVKHNKERRVKFSCKKSAMFPDGAGEVALAAFSEHAFQLARAHQVRESAAAALHRLPADEDGGDGARACHRLRVFLIRLPSSPSLLISRVL